MPIDIDSDDSSEDSTVRPQVQPKTTLLDRLDHLYEKSKFCRDELFLPENAIRVLVTYDTVTELIGWIVNKAPKLFLLHVQTRHEGKTLFSCMSRFKKYDFNDGQLPIEEPPRDPKWRPPSHFHRKYWEASRVREFYGYQWRFLSPIFTQIQNEHNLHVKTILPFIDIDTREMKEGAFSSVYKVTIHEAHQEYSINQAALKEIRVDHSPGIDAEAVWGIEARALGMISGLNHAHIVKCIAAIRQGDKRYFMFPWASGGSLRDFWEEKSTQHPTKELIRQTLQQLRGLADALCQLHEYDPKNSSQVEEPVDEKLSNIRLEVDGQPVVVTNESGNHSIRHGDLKPENILRFFGEQTSYPEPEIVGVLKIADMGLAKRHVVATQDRKWVTSTRHGTIRYEPPEVTTTLQDEGRSRLYDVWSMGCIILEFILWILHGNKLIVDLYESLQSTTKQDCPYFELEEGTRKTARVHRVVQEWIGYLQKHDPECQEGHAIGDLLKLVQTKLLVVDLPPNRRIAGKGQPIPEAPLQLPEHGEDKRNYRSTSKDFLGSLDKLLLRCVDEKYVFSGQPRDDVKPPSVKPGSHGSATLLPSSDPVRRTTRRLEVRGPQSTYKSFTKTNTDYTLPPLKDWNYFIDNAFAGKVTDKLGDDSLRPQPREAVTLCQRCAHLNFWTGGFFIEDKSSNLHEKSAQCHFCAMMWNAYKAFGLSKSLRVRFEIDKSTLRLSGINHKLPVFSIIRSPELRTPLDIQIGFPQLLQPGTDLFFKLIILWLRDCDDHNGCKARESPTLPTRLIDVGTTGTPRLRLVETEDDMLQEQRYIALSHQWGDRDNHPPFRTLRRDPSGLGQELGAFKKAIPEDQLPATFKDAVLTTRALKVRYLWIDSLCIIQGEDGDFNDEAKRMENVFSYAYCVLAASRAAGQHDGFLKPLGSRKYITFQRGTEQPFYVCEAIDNFGGDVLEGSLNTRGWVLQERALARRTVFFTKNQTYFECGEGVRCQSLTKMHNNMADFIGDPNFPKKATGARRCLKIRYFQDLYKKYSRLKFTHIEDRPFAIKGLESRLREAYGIDGAYGIFNDGPDKGLFHRSLLWQRGKDEPEPGLSRILFPPERKATVPTWSWMAYRGGIDYLDLPFNQTEWRANDIQPPRIKSNSIRTQRAETSPSDSGMELIATARRFNIAGHQDGEVGVVYDRARDKSDDSQPQCVVIARSKVGNTDQEKKHYILLVSPTKSTGRGGDRVYERVGAGFMLGKFIALNEPGQPARIR
ncbi:hypothetical protein F5Y19DRAFT_488559 [Xylariaceae sp. FL1651]|nr:hypothetical protein F5Y19DRAFT_488559 [Xylariaceae sp. FL1651]